MSEILGNSYAELFLSILSIKASDLQHLDMQVLRN